MPHYVVEFGPLILLMVISIGSIIPFANASAPAQSTIGTVIPIEVPVLTNSVSLNGKVDGDEWSDAPQTNLTLLCTYGCDHAPASVLSVTVRLKHDEKWLYFLFQTNWSTVLSNVNDVSADFEYHWSANGWGPYTFANYLWPWGIGWGASEAYEDPTTQQLIHDHGASKYPVVEAYGNAVGDSLTYEFRALLKSGYPDHWSLSPGGTYGVPGVDGMMFMEFCAGPGSFNSGCPWDYYRSVSLNLLKFPMAVPSATSTTRSASSITSLTSTSTETTSSQSVVLMPFSTIGLPGLGPLSGNQLLIVILLAMVVIVVGVLLYRRRRGGSRSVTRVYDPVVTVPVSRVEKDAAVPEATRTYARAETRETEVASVTYCPQCGTENLSDSKFCRECATRINSPRK